MTLANWNEIVEGNYKAIFAFCFHFLGNRHEADDATQDTFLKTFRAKESIQKIAPNEIKFWLYRVARNVCIDRKRWWKRLHNFHQSQTQVSSLETDQGLTMTLRKLILQLPQKQKEVFILRHWHGFSTAETAKLLKIDEGSVKSHLSRAISKLKLQILNTEKNNEPTTDSTSATL